MTCKVFYLFIQGSNVKYNAPILSKMKTQNICFNFVSSVVSYFMLELVSSRLKLVISLFWGLALDCKIRMADAKTNSLKKKKKLIQENCSHWGNNLVFFQLLVGAITSNKANALSIE